MDYVSANSLDLRPRRLLSNHERATSHLAVETGSSRRTRWVLKIAEGGGTGAVPRDLLRADAADLASLRHISLALPAAFGRAGQGGRLCVARPYIEGDDIRQGVKSRSPRDLVPWFVLAAQALGLLHRFGFLHRNLKASNLIVPRMALPVRAGGEPRLVLSDPAWWPEGSEHRAEGVLIAPEVRSGERATFASDLYSLGGVFYRLLTGREPRPASAGFPRLPDEGRSGISTDLSRILGRLLHSDARARYPRAAALLEDLRGVLGAPSAGLDALPDYFFDRRDELGRVVRALEDASRPLTIGVGGEAGIGKTAFLRRVHLEAQLRGYRSMLVEGGGEQGSRGSALEGLLRQVLPAGRAGSMLRAKVRTLLDRATEGGDLTLRGWLAHELAGLLAAGSRGPSVIIVDDAHQASPLLLETLAAIVREASSRGSGGEAGRFPGLVVSYRSESPFHALVAPLVEALRRASAPAGGGVPVDCQLELSQLPVEAVQDWVDLVLPEDPGTRDRIQYALDLHRRPFALHEAMRGDGARRAAVPALSGDLEAVHASYLASLGKREREVVEVLAVLGRPAGADLLAGVLGARGQDLAPSIESLLRAGALVEASGILSLRHASFGAWLLQSLEQEIPADASGGNRRSSIHRRIALWLERTRAEPLHEVAFHWLRSPTPRRALLAARTAARRLAAAGEDRRALEFYAAIISILPAKGGSKARAIRGEAAEAYSRVGEHGRGVEILESLLPVAAERREAAVIHGRLGILCHRAGDVGRAVSHLEEGMVLLEGLPGGAARQDRLRFASELAEISGKRGDYARAEELCADALGEIQKRRSGRPAREVRHVEMVLLETLAHVKLRRFQHEEARRLFERSLAISGELGANAERGLILNNLAVLHNQQNRFAEAIACYQEAERLSASRGGDVSLVNVHSNLAHLYAKIGQPEAADEAIQRAAYHDERSGSKRTRFLRLHCTALVDLCFGRFEKAAEAFAEASALAEQLEDVFLASFDLVYLGECQVFRGEFEAAEGALARALSLGGPAAVHVAAMVRARRAVLLALRGKPKDARAACFDGAESSSIPFVDAWNDVFLGWACRLVGSPQEASRRLERARAFFARVGVPQGEIHAELELAALETDTGDLAGAEKRLRALRGRHAVGRGALKSSMLSARLLAYQARILLDGGRGEVEEASALVSEAEGYLVGRRLRDLEGMLRDLRRRLESLLPQGANGGLQDAATERPPLMAGEADLLEGRGAAAGADRIRPPGEAASVNGLGPLLDQLAREVDTALPGAGGSGVRAALDALRSHWSAGASKASESERRNSVGVAAIRGQSPAIRSVIIQVRDLAPLDHSVLITGETGTGKELVARALHGEGPRRGGPFVSVNCAALPDELLEAELFGYVKGAFSSAERDHPGLLLGSAGGTILFDEVGEMPLRTQGKLLRALERGSVRPLGGLAEVKTDVRYLFSSNRDLRMLVSEGKFRSDLFFRLGAFEIRLPPLRERREDLPALVDHIRRQAGAARPLFEESALQALADSSWPGNVRELENVVKRLVLTNAERVSGQDVRAVLGRASVEGIFPEVILRSRPLDELRAQLEREYMRQLHRDRGGSLKAMAQALGISVKALYKRMRVLGIRPRDLEPPGRGS